MGGPPPITPPSWLQTFSHHVALPMFQVSFKVRRRSKRHWGFQDCLFVFLSLFNVGSVCEPQFPRFQARRLREQSPEAGSRSARRSVAGPRGFIGRGGGVRASATSPRWLSGVRFHVYTVAKQESASELSPAVTGPTVLSSRASSVDICG